MAAPIIDLPTALNAGNLTLQNKDKVLVPDPTDALSAINKRRSGGVVVTPTNVVTSGSGSTASVSAAGVITFSGATQVALDGLFEAEVHATYKIYTYVSLNAPGSVSSRMRRGGGNLTGTPYNYLAIYANSTMSPGRSHTYATGAFGWWSLNVPNSPLCFGEMTLTNVNWNTTTKMLLRTSVAASDRWNWSEVGDTGGNPGADTGIAIVASGSGTMSGYMRVERVM